MKLFSIGNSFSDDSTACLNPVSIAGDNEIKSVNVYYPACSLEQHIQFFENDEAAYNLEYNGIITPKKVKLIDMLTEDKYDAITVQQCSQFSGKEDTYEPYLTKLLQIVKAHQPWAKLYFIQTWTYEYDHKSDFFRDIYNNDQHYMYECAKACSEKAAKNHGLTLIPVGEVINRLRSHPFFDYKNGGKSLNRDGIHLDTTYARLAAAYTMFETLTGYDSRENFCAKFTSKPEIMADIKKVVHEVVTEYGVNFRG